MIQELQYIEAKISNLETKLNDVRKQNKKILEKLSKKEKIDFFKRLPLKNEGELNNMESNLNNDYYRNQMVRIALILKSICLR